MTMCTFLFCGLLSFASDDATRMKNEEAALQPYYFETAFKGYCNTYKNAPLNDEAAIKAGKELLAQLCGMPSQAEHKDLQDMRWQMINELEVRLEFTKKTEERNYSVLIDRVRYTHNSTAYKHVAEYLINNPSKDTTSLIPTYLQELSKKDIEPLFDKAVRVALQQANGNLLATLMCEGTSKKIPNVITRIAEELFAKKHASFFAPVIDTFIGAVILTDITAEIVKPTNNQNVVLLQSLLSIATADFKTVGDMLSTHKDLMVPFMNAAEKLIAYKIKKPAKPSYLYKPCVPWNREFRCFFNSCFKQPFDEQTCSSLASLLFKKYESNPTQWKKLSLWVCCAATQYMLVHQKKELSTEMLQRSTKDFAHLFSMHLREDVKEKDEDFINGLYVGIYENRKNKQLFNEQLLNTNDLVLLASCKAAHLSDYLMKEKRFDTIPLPCDYDKVADAMITSLGDSLEKNGFVKRLEAIATESSPSALRALRVLLRYDLHENVEKGKEYSLRLHGLYKKEGNAERITEAETCCKVLTHQGVAEAAVRMRQQVEDSYQVLYEQLYGEIFADEDSAELSRLAFDHKDDPIMHALHASKYALSHKRGEDTVAISRMILSCAQARRFAPQILNSKWQAYLTPLCKELLWQEATALCEKSDADTMQLDFSLIAYAAYVNPLKSFEEKQCLLKKGAGKHPFCSLLYAKNIIENSNDRVHERSWDQRYALYFALSYAIMQKQRSKALAATLDQVTQEEAVKMLEDSAIGGDFGSIIVLASMQPDLPRMAGYIGLQPFRGTHKVIAFDVPVDNYIGLARYYNILDSIETIAKNGNTIARSALFRIYFPKVYDHVNAGEIEANIDLIERIIEYGSDYIFHEQHGKQALVKSYVLPLINSIIAKNIKVSEFKKLKADIEKL